MRMIGERLALVPAGYEGGELDRPRAGQGRPQRADGLRRRHRRRDAARPGRPGRAVVGAGGRRAPSSSLVATTPDGRTSRPRPRPSSTSAAASSGRSSPSVRRRSPGCSGGGPARGSSRVVAVRADRRWPMPTPMAKPIASPPPGRVGLGLDPADVGVPSGAEPDGHDTRPDPPSGDRPAQRAGRVVLGRPAAGHAGVVDRRRSSRHPTRRSSSPSRSPPSSRSSRTHRRPPAPKRSSSTTGRSTTSRARPASRSTTSRSGPTRLPEATRVRVLVTGGAGYIGSETVRRLAARGHEPVVLDTLERGHRAARRRSAARRRLDRRRTPGRGDHPRTRHRGGDPFRRPEVGRGLAARPGRLLRDERRRFVRARPGDGPERGSAARLLVVVRGLRHAVLPAGQGDERAPPGEPLRRDEAPRRARAGLVRRRRLQRDQPALLQRRRCRLRRAPRRGLDRCAEPRPGRHQGDPRSRAAGPGPRLRLSDARRDRDPRLRPRGRPRRRSPRRRRGPRRRPGRHGPQPRDRGRLVGPRGDRGGRPDRGPDRADDRGAETRRATRRRSGRTRRSPRRSSAGGPSHGLDAIVETAWRWHSTHLDGYGPESAETEAVPAAERR